MCKITGKRKLVYTYTNAQYIQHKTIQMPSLTYGVRTQTK